MHSDELRTVLPYLAPCAADHVARLEPLSEYGSSVCICVCVFMLRGCVRSCVCVYVCVCWYVWLKPFVPIPPSDSLTCLIFPDTERWLSTLTQVTLTGQSGGG